MRRNRFGSILWFPDPFQVLRIILLHQWLSVAFPLHFNLFNTKSVDCNLKHSSILLSPKNRWKDNFPDASYTPFFFNYHAWRVSSQMQSQIRLNWMLLPLSSIQTVNMNCILKSRLVQNKSIFKALYRCLQISLAAAFPKEDCFL